jgi:hypothetical protein
MTHETNSDNPGGPDGPHFSAEVDPAEVAAWTEIEDGRYMPRRVRGSFRGRALG